MLCTDSMHTFERGGGLHALSRMDPKMKGNTALYMSTPPSNNENNSMKHFQ